MIALLCILILSWSDCGTGINVYIIDTGIRYTHVEFEGRAHPFWSMDGGVSYLIDSAKTMTFMQCLTDSIKASYLMIPLKNAKMVYSLLKISE